jgi:hypothetical protein
VQSRRYFNIYRRKGERKKGREDRREGEERKGGREEEENKM